MKKLLSLLAAVLMVLSLCVSPVFAADTYNIVQPGNPRSDVPEYNYAWLDNLIMRDDPMSVTAKEIIPRPEDYPGSHTFTEFVEESNGYAELYALSENAAAGAYDEVIETIYYLVAAMGMTDEISVMREYLAASGIMLDPNEGVADKAKIAVVYAVMKYDAVYVLYGTHTDVPVGSTLDGAVVTVLAALTGVFVPSGVDTISDFAMLIMENYVTSFDAFPISDDPSAEEIIYWTKVITAASNDYQVPMELYSETSDAQKEYVDYAYYASMLSSAYDVQIDPFKLVLAEQSGEEFALQKLILKTMLDEKNIPYSTNMACDEMFDLAAANGWFALENELYCDILKYDVYVGTTCTKLWFTPFPVAGQVGTSEEEYVTMRLAGEVIASGSTIAVTLDPSKSTETILLEVYYNGPDRSESAVYEFTVIKTAALDSSDTASGNDLVGQVKDYVNSIVPTDNEKVSTIVDGVFDGVESAVTTASSGNTLTTFSDDEVSTSTSAGTSGQSYFDFEYLEELMNGVYATDADGNIVTTYSISGYSEDDSDDEESIITKTVEAVKENPEIVAAPTSLAAIGALAGYLISKKHKVSEAFDTEDEEDTEE